MPKSTFQNEVPRPLGMALVEPSQEGGARAALLLEGRSNHRVSNRPEHGEAIRSSPRSCRPRSCIGTAKSRARWGCCPPGVP